MRKYLLIFLFVSSRLFAQSIEFKGKIKLSLEQLKKQFKTNKVDTYNFYTRSNEGFLAFDFNKILNHVYGSKEWRESTSLKVTTTDDYTPLIETYKFKKRKAYLAYARYDQKPFTTIGQYRDKIIDLSPFYLVWKEDYKKGAAKRRNHWPYKISGIQLQKSEDEKIIPEKGVNQDIIWGYKNFYKQCIACHKVNGVGGMKGDELIENNLVSEKTDEYLLKFIDNPRSIIQKAEMPRFPDKINLRSKRIKDIVKYLRYLDDRRKGKKKKSKSMKFNTKEWYEFIHKSKQSKNKIEK